jgi:DNA-binding response OmpR family regulator
MGADRFLVKPIQLDDVVAFIRRAVQERGKKPASTPDASLDRAAMEGSTLHRHALG